MFWHNFCQGLITIALYELIQYGCRRAKNADLLNHRRAPKPNVRDTPDVRSLYSLNESTVPTREWSQAQCHQALLDRSLGASACITDSKAVCEVHKPSSQEALGEPQNSSVDSRKPNNG